MRETTAGDAVRRNGSIPIPPRVIAVITGLLGAVLAILTPLLPVRQSTVQIDWPQNNTLASLNAPLISYVPTDLWISVPCHAVAGLSGTKSVLVSTVPKQAPNAVDRGLLVERIGDNLSVIVRNTPLLSAPLDRVLTPACQRLEITAHADKITARFVGLVHDATDRRPGEPIKGELGGYDWRPQLVGVFTDLSGPAPAGLRLTAAVDTRYDNSPSVIKFLAMVVGAASTGLSLVALHRLDTRDGRKRKRLLPLRWWRRRPVDMAVLTMLLWWHFVGANTSDDGFILTWARVSEHAGYLSNYYRWFGTPEAPFGWYNDFLALWAHVSTASVWMRLPELAIALLCWTLIIRVVIPRLGHAVRHKGVAQWTAAGMFLAFWLPFNNGLRPEPVIAVSILLTWCLVERAVATRRLLPAAVACIMAAITVLSGPTGIAAVGVLLIAIRPLSAIVRQRARQFGYAALLSPILAAGLITLTLAFRDQTLIGEVQANMLRSTVGPSLKWFQEYVRYERLFQPNPDGAIARRYPVLALLIALGVTVAMTLRKNRIPGTASGPSRRIIGLTIFALVTIMFTPTKWTHHFGAFAGLAGALGALVAVAVTSAGMRSPRNRSLYAALVCFVLALSFASVNGWWYVSNFGVPWSNSFPHWHFGISTLFLGLSVLAVVLAAWLHLTDRDQPRLTPQRPALALIAESPLAIASWIVVMWAVASLTMGMVNQYPAWSVGRSNLQTLAGKSCGLADDVLVEQDPNAGMLTPTDVPVAAGLDSTLNFAFTPDGIPKNVSADISATPPGSDNFVERNAGGQDNASDTGAAGGGITLATGVNGSRAPLPFNLDPARTPVLGSFQPGRQEPARLQTAWYRLPHTDPGRPLIVVSAAGRFGPSRLKAEFANDKHQILAERSFADVGAAPAWRNLRMPRSEAPAGSTQIRLIANDNDLAPGRWMAITPPRIPTLQSLQIAVGSTQPVLLDWLVGMAFPCQRPFNHKNGVIEVPQWRILPDRFGADANSPVMDYLGGGPLGITELLLKATTVPTYLNHDWQRDWGSLQQFRLYYPAEDALLQLDHQQRSGLWSPAPLRKSR
ncbi:arabinosyltransferase domain-containing protein [Mycobacterium haemophilum]